MVLPRAWKMASIGLAVGAAAAGAPSPRTLTEMRCPRASAIWQAMVRFQISS